MSDQSGTSTARDSSLGPAIDDKWWPNVADQILRRFLPFGQGDGPDPQLVDPLVNGLQVVFDAKGSDDKGEAKVRRFLDSPKSPTDKLSEELIQNLTDRSSPYLRNQLRGQSPGLFPSSQPKSLGLVSSAPPQTLGVKDVPDRPTPTGRNQPNDYWRTLAYAERSFDEERTARQDVYNTFLGSFGGNLKDRFAKDSNVMVDEAAWQDRFQMAMAISSGASANYGDDDYHSESPSNRVPRSNWLIGELVHAVWQFQYMASRWQNDIIGEYMFTKGGTPKGGKGIRGELMDYRDLDPNPKNPTLTAAARFAFGNYRPDILDLTDRCVYEIKPIRGASNGVLQIWRYSHNFNCARYFDELNTAGAAGKGRYFLSPAAATDSPFSPVDLTNAVDQYLAVRPGAKRKPTWIDLYAMLKKGKSIWAIPILVPAIPGLVLYTISETNKPGKKEQDQLTEMIKTGLLVVGAVAVIAAIVAISIATGGAADAVAIGLAGETAAELTAGEVTVEVLGDTLVVSEIPTFTSAVSESLGQLSAVMQ